MNDDFLVSLGLELCQEFQEWNYSLIDDWLNSIELLEKDLQPIARLHLAIEDLSEITDLCRDWEAWLTADFVAIIRLYKRSKKIHITFVKRNIEVLMIIIKLIIFIRKITQRKASKN